MTSAFNFKDSDSNEIKPGALYCERINDAFGPGEHDYGRLVWAGADGRFYDADSEEEVGVIGDLVRQVGDLNKFYAG